MAGRTAGAAGVQAAYDLSHGMLAGGTPNGRRRPSATCSPCRYAAAAPPWPRSPPPPPNPSAPR